MKFQKPVAKTELENILLSQIEKDTPDKVKNNQLIDLNNKQEFTFTITKSQLDDFNNETEALGINKWFENYEKEAKVSTAGIRGIQNPLYPWDTRYPLNLVGMTLATMGKILVANDIEGQKTKISASEVRYCSSQYVELIARLQAANGIKTYLTRDYMPIPIFLISFIIFMYDLYGGEYVTSSHAISKKIATKDLNTQGSQYIPEESMLFVNKVKQILETIKKDGSYTFTFSSDDSALLDRTTLESINNGINLYIEYLKNGVASDVNLNYINNSKKPIVIECMGGSMFRTLDPILNNLGIRQKYEFLHQEEDPFFHQIGKTIDKVGKFFDWSCDTTIMNANLSTLQVDVPVVDTIHYEKLLKDYPIGTVLLITDPDADRLVTSYIDTINNLEKITKMGLVSAKLTDDKILVIFTPNQSFLMTIDFQYRSLKESGQLNKYNWFLMKTTASQRSWDEWAQSHNVPVINTPVGFKELADSMQQIEKKMKQKPGQDVYLKDVYGNNVNLGKNPRLLFAGEESGGEIFGPAKLITSNAGRQAISMREKSAGEAVIITSALSSYIDSRGLTLADYLNEIFTQNNIKSKYEIRIDQKFYNESEPDINILLKEKAHGMEVKTKNNSYFLSISIGYKDNLITFDQVKEILVECFPELNFDDFTEVKFVGDGNLFLFSDKCLEVRPSGTDAVNKSYSYGSDQWECIKYAKSFAGYDGHRTPKHIKYIPQDFYDKIESYAFDLYMQYKQNQ